MSGERLYEIHREQRALMGFLRGPEWAAMSKRMRNVWDMLAATVGVYQ
jgi:hypothetical protein